MSSKRSRIVRSSSQGEIGLFNQIQPIESPVTFFKSKRSAPVKESQANNSRCIFSLGSPEKQKNESEWSKRNKPNEGFGEFLKACSLCKKKLDEGQVLYMYGFLGAFCSIDCREDRMALDGFEEEMAKEIAMRRNYVKSLVPKDGRKLGFLGH